MTLNEKIEQGKQKPLILYSPLDWGLGHTARSIPLIREFIDQGCRVLIACNSIQKQILEEEFPACGFLHLEGYNVKYGRNRLLTRVGLLFYSVKILIKINQENRWMRKFLTENTVTAVVSDNRYGFRSPHLPSVLLTHQLSGYTGSGRIADRLIQYILYKWISKFKECWIPDYRNTPNLTGLLAHPAILPLTDVKYIGPLSRFNREPELEIQHDILIILSGPEPQRTIFEQRILQETKSTVLKIVLVRGLPSLQIDLAPAHIQVLPHANAVKLNKLICSSSLVISRSGYTTVMDLVKLRKKMVLVPTPGQPEQEYLSKHLEKNNLAPSIDQNKFSVSKAVSVASSFNYQFPDSQMDDYKATIAAFVSTLK